MEIANMAISRGGILATLIQDAVFRVTNIAVNIPASKNTNVLEITFIITTKATFIILRRNTIIASLTRDAVFVVVTIKAKPL
ncbi:uncharacterized protein [Mytilus edulis]|uniref:uncharacterized protein isoform X2 n=1 Tax=Mytilus edulis TaxID=6550 RepID=UPI0039EE1A40